MDDTVKHAEAFEAAIRNQSQLHNSSDAQASHVSDYHKIKNKTFHKQQSCSGCGSSQDGTIGKKPRHSHCPAWGKSGTNCNLPNHTATVCRKPSTTSSLIAHVQYNSNANSFSSPNTLQEIPAKVSPDIANIQPVTLDIFPDSGANICLAGPKQFHRLGLQASHLRSCHKRVKAVGGSFLSCTGWLPVTFDIKGHCTTQPLYFCDKVDKLYFSKQACIDVNILPSSYPMPMSVTQDPCSHVIVPPTTKNVKRTPPPSKPQNLPYEPISENIPKLKQYIIDSFASSAFNNTATPFPAPSTPPAQIHLKPNALPYAIHTPITVPHHFKAEVKAMLDRDVERCYYSSSCQYPGCMVCSNGYCRQARQYSMAYN